MEINVPLLIIDVHQNEYKNLKSMQTYKGVVGWEYVWIECEHDFLTSGSDLHDKLVSHFLTRMGCDKEETTWKTYPMR